MDLYSEIEAKETIDNILGLCNNSDRTYAALVELFEYQNYFENLEKLESVYATIDTLKKIDKKFPVIGKKRFADSKENMMLNCIEVLVEFEYFKKYIKLKNEEKYNDKEKFIQQKKRYAGIIKQIEKKYEEIKPFLKSEEDIYLKLPKHPNNIYTSYQFLFMSTYGVDESNTRVILNRLINTDYSEYMNSDCEIEETKLKMTNETKGLLVELKKMYKEKHKKFKSKTSNNILKAINKLIT